MLGEVAASLAHEIRQPIAALMIDATACLRALAGQSRGCVRSARGPPSRIVKEATWADEIITRTSALYRKDATQRERVDVNAVIRDMAVLLQQEAAASSISIRTELAEGLPGGHRGSRPAAAGVDEPDAECDRGDEGYRR